VVARSGGRRVIPLAADVALRLHPTRALLGLAAAVLAPAGEGWLYFDLEESHADVSEGLVAVVGELGRLLERFAPDRNPAPADAEPAAVAGLVGGSDRMRLLFETIARAARFDMTVHVCGETGTGKERVAHALHQRSARASRPFVAVNASSLSDELFESEMFGHLRGSFTGAVADREGHVAAAEGGTLFLDEITDLSPRAQAKLLRLLEAKEYRRVGESRTRTADVRFVTASNVPLEQRVAEGRFRADLMYRLQRMVLSVPPLRERGDDVLLLARHFLRRAAGRSGVPLPALAGDAERALRAHAWPGNVRELANVVEHASILCERLPIGTEHLPHKLDAARGGAAPRPHVRAFGPMTLRELEMQAIHEALTRNDGNKPKTADELGISLKTLYNKLNHEHRWERSA
jgi:two-component system NtrC family response regulator